MRVWSVLCACQYQPDGRWYYMVCDRLACCGGHAKERVRKNLWHQQSKLREQFGPGFRYRVLGVGPAGSFDEYSGRYVGQWLDEYRARYLKYDG